MNAQSGYIDTGLGQLSLSSNIISSEAVELRIIGRNPASGSPPSGVPFSLDLEVETFRNWAKVLFVPFMASWGQCPDALVVVRSEQTGSVLGFQRFRTSMMDGCRSKGRIIFDRSFVPTSGHKVIFEVYPVDVEMNSISASDLIAKSAPISLDLDQKTGEQSGVYSPPTESWYKMPEFEPGNTLSEVNKLIKGTLIIGGLIGGLYLFAPMLPGLRAGIKALAPKVGTE